MKSDELKSIIVKKYHTVSNFQRKYNLNKDYVSRILNNKRRIDTEDISFFKDKLKLSDKQVVDIFLDN